MELHRFAQQCKEVSAITLNFQIVRFTVCNHSNKAAKLHNTCTNFLVLCCTPVMQVFLINLVLGLVAFAVRSMQWVVFGRLRAAEWQVPSAT